MKASQPAGRPAKVCYLASPYTAKTEWGRYLNVTSAHYWAKEIWRKGWACISPVSNSAWMSDGDDYELWMEGGLAILDRCDAFCIAPGGDKSRGCQRELARAKELGLAIYYGVDEVPDETEKTKS